MDADRLRQSYEQLAYSFGLHRQVNIGHLHAVARFLGHPAARPERARVLEIGCGAGPDLLAMAAAFPQAEFVGIDFAGNAIDLAREIAAAAELPNVSFAAADLSSWQPPDEPFDYVIAHGFFSWVPDPVKEALLSLLPAILSPEGVACVSYAAYPGSKYDDALRDLLLMHTAGLEAPARKADATRQTLDFLDRAWASLPKLGATAGLRDAARRIRAKEIPFLLHDDLGGIRDPCYLLQFIEWAGEFGLSYLGDAEPHTMFLENLPARAAAELAAMRLPQVDTEQMIDYIVHRTFRSSLLVRGPERGAALDPAAIEQLALASPLRPSGKKRKTNGPSLFTSKPTGRIEVANPVTAGFLTTLTGHAHDFTGFSRLREEFESGRGQALDADERRTLLADLATLVTRRAIDLLATPITSPLPGDDRPHLGRLNRIYARRFSLLCSADHRPVQLDDAQRDFCLLLDGSRTLDQLADSSEARRLGGKMDRFLEFLRTERCLEA